MKLSNNNKIPLLIYLSTGIILLFNLFISYKLFEDRSINQKLMNHINKLIYTNEQYKSYINQTILHPIYSFEQVLQSIQASDSSQFIQDSTYIILLPSDACYACISDIFMKLDQLKVNKNIFHLFLEQTNKQIQRDWLSFNFSHYYIDNKKIFSYLKLKDNIIIIKSINGKIHSILYNTQNIDHDSLLLFLSKSDIDVI